MARQRVTPVPPKNSRLPRVVVAVFLARGFKRSDGPGEHPLCRTVQLTSATYPLFLTNTRRKKHTKARAFTFSQSSTRTVVTHLHRPSHCCHAQGCLNVDAFIVRNDTQDSMYSKMTNVVWCQVRPARNHYFSFFFGRSCDEWPHERFRQLVARGGRRA
jgi:hypothetical protein